MPLDHTDAVDVQMRKMIEATNEIVRLTQDLIASGQVLNEAKGKFAEIKARIKTQKEIINSLKIIIRAEASHL